ncbi:DUF547 domain-containing protein [Thalassospira alkalitolerans]|uniref:DUF547 domain-containing protein n=1 Tax=Thalassospira alkalitolerans TaxID=1293890 RepID=A0A1Y2L8A2_9PROT|nr:DUF547 domain-containing protein [Thalassospira alkalitolerans]OSQ46237.1 hypothetical protein TALK_16710 [Thalassospira alkalitolerans]|tara:strand:+ start:181857 stop:182696 length:840 start_codon:yes stop_codon:yes gene_type:complete
MRIIVPILVMLWIVVPLRAGAAPDADLWPDWQVHDAQSTARIDHSIWQDILDRHLILEKAGVSLFDYRSAKAQSRSELDAYIAAMQAVAISTYNRDQQLAYWINLYNAETVAIVIDHYPVESIHDIDISPGFFSSGPWGKKVLQVEGRSLSLDDIEHRILRPIWKDARIHYTVNCASVGCPALAADAYDADKLEEQLDTAALAFIRDPRAVQLTPDDTEIKLSSLYDWYRSDFGDEDQTFADHLARYSGLKLATWLSVHGDDLPIADYEYDWSLNDAKP